MAKVKITTTSITNSRRRKIFKRDDYTCQYCGFKGQIWGGGLEIDHITPRSKGGKNNVENLRTSCMPCNIWKSNLSMKKFRQLMLKKIHLSDLQRKYFVDFLKVQMPELDDYFFFFERKYAQD